MEIREDYFSEQERLSKFLYYSRLFDQYNKQKWSYVKNSLDFNSVYEFDTSISYVFDKLYGCGRDIAVHFSGKLEEFNTYDFCTNFKNFIESLISDVNSAIKDSDQITLNAKNICRLHSINLKSISGMISYHAEQKDILIDVLNIANQLKHSCIYM